MSHILLSFIYVPCIALLVCSFPSHPFSFSVWLSSSYSALPHTGRTRPPGPHPVPCISIITHAHTRWSRYHQARLTAFTPWARLTLMPRALTSAQPQSSNHVPSAPHAASPASPAPLNGTLSSHAMTACAHPQAVAARREPTMTARSQPARSGPGLALHAPASRAPHRARPPQTPLAPPASRCHRIP